MRKASRIYKRKSRSNLETVIILIGAIIILGVAFHLAREKSYIPPENQTIVEEKKEEIPVKEVSVESPSKVIVEKSEEKTKPAETETKKEAIVLERKTVSETTTATISKEEPKVNVVLEEPEVGSEKRIYTIQVGAFSTEKSALELAKAIKSKGYHTYVIKGKTLYKVQVGEFKTSDEAKVISEKLKKLGYEIWVTTK
jgi:cell division septation protein DedD